MVIKGDEVTIQVSNEIEFKRTYNVVFADEFGLDNVIKREVIHLKKGNRIEIRIKRTNSNNLQGLRIATISKDVSLKYKRDVKREHWFWENKIGHRKIVLSIDGDGYIMIYNACYIQGNKIMPGAVSSNTDYAGMVVERIDDTTFMYYCNDFAKSTEFQSLVFQLKIK